MAKNLGYDIRGSIEEGSSGVPLETLLYSRLCDRAQDNAPNARCTLKHMVMGETANDCTSDPQIPGGAEHQGI